MHRRDFLKGMAGILAAASAPAIVHATNIMPVRPLKQRASGVFTFDSAIPGAATHIAILDAQGNVLGTRTVDDVTRGFEIPVVKTGDMDRIQLVFANGFPLEIRPDTFTRKLLVSDTVNLPGGVRISNV